MRRAVGGEGGGGGGVVNSTSLGDCTRLPITEGRSSILESVPSLGAGRTSKFQECFEGCIFLELPFTACLHFIVPQKESEIDLSRESQRFANRRFPTQLASREHLLKSFFGFCASRKGFTYTPQSSVRRLKNCDHIGDGVRACGHIYMVSTNYRDTFVCCSNYRDTF